MFRTGINNNTRTNEQLREKGGRELRDMQVNTAHTRCNTFEELSLSLTKN